MTIKCPKCNLTASFKISPSAGSKALTIEVSTNFECRNRCEPSSEWLEKTALKLFCGSIESETVND